MISISNFEKLKEFPSLMENEIELLFRAYSQEVINLARLGNKYLAEQEPWKLIKTDPKRWKPLCSPLYKFQLH